MKNLNEQFNSSNKEEKTMALSNPVTKIWLEKDLKKVKLLEQKRIAGTLTNNERRELRKLTGNKGNSGEVLELKKELEQKDQVELFN